MRYTGHTLHILHMQWDYLEHQYAGLVRSQGRQRRRAQGSSAGQRVAPGPHAAVQQAGSSSGSALGNRDAAKEGDAQHRDEAEAEAEAEAAAEAADEPQLSAGLELLERARLLAASDGGGEWAALTLDETWLERPEALRECATRASAGQPRDCTTPLTPQRSAMAMGENVTKHMAKLRAADNASPPAKINRGEWVSIQTASTSRDVACAIWKAEEDSPASIGDSPFSRTTAAIQNV